MSPCDSHPVTLVDGTDLIKILQSKFSTAGHLTISIGVEMLYYHKINGEKRHLKNRKIEGKCG